MKEKFLSCIYDIKNKYEKTKVISYIIQCIGIFIALIFLVKIGDLLHVKLLIAPFGASSVILFGFPHSHFSHPKNIIGGYFICSLIGVVIYVILGSNSYGIAMGVSLAVMVMLLTNLMHPPAGAVTIIAVTSGAGWIFPLVPVGLGALFIVVSAWIYNNIHKKISDNIREKYQPVVPKMDVSE